jgi:HD-like signal output (HDOD) protein
MLRFEDIEQSVFPYSHAELGGYVLEKWNLPKILINSVMMHHSFAFTDQDDTFQRNLTAITALADLICIKLGIGTRAPLEEIDLIQSQAAIILEMNEEILTQLEGVISETYIKDKGFFNIQ